MGCTILQRRLCNKKVIIVLDDVDNIEQLRVLANSTKWFGCGSRIIITTRDRHMLTVIQANHIYEIQSLSYDESLQLFCHHAFKQNQPKKGFLKLSKDFVTYAHGLPLVLVVLGTFLYGRKENVWEGELDKLKRIPNPDVYHILRISYDNLDDDLLKDIFLHIAFFFNGESESAVGNVLEQCGLYPSRAFDVLRDKTMLIISNNRLYIHDLLRQMAYEIVREQSKDPRKRSRLCDPDDVRFVLTNGKEMSTIEGILLDVAKIKSTYLKPDAFMGLDHLRILRIYHCNWPYNEQKIHLLEGLDFLPNELRSLCWNGFPAKSLPSSFTGENLVELLLQESPLEHLWQGEAELPSLRKLDLSNDKFLKTLPNLSTSTKIEEIILYSCESLIEFSSNLENHYILKDLNLGFCKKLHKLPKLPLNLKMLALYGCESLIALPTEIKEMGCLETLVFSHTAVKEFPASVMSLESLLRLAVTVESMSEIPQSICKLKYLQMLRFDNVPIKELPECITELKSLKTLVLFDVAITKLPEFIVHMQLEELYLRGCRKLVSLPNCLNEFSSLVQLCIKGCISLCSLPELPSSLIEVIVEGCESLQTVPTDDRSHFQDLQYLSFVNCKKLDHKVHTEFLEHLRGLILHTKVLPKRYDDRFYWGVPYLYVVAGNEIPNWFHYKSCGSSITTRVPSYLHQFRGVAYCFVHGGEDHEIYYYNSPSFRVGANNYFSVPHPFSRYRVRGDHIVVLVNCIEKDHFAGILGCDVQFDFELIYRHKHLKGKVKKCGIYYIPCDEGEEEYLCLMKAVMIKQSC